MPQLLNPLATVQQVESTPSRLDGIPASLEEELRMYGCQLIQQAGILMKLPQVTMATAQVLFQRFYYVSSLKSFAVRDTCMGALFLASKLEETPRRLRDLLNVFHFLVSRAQHAAKHRPGFRSEQLHSARGGGNRSRNSRRQENGNAGTDLANEGSSQLPTFTYVPMSYFSSEFYDAKDALVIAEMQLLKRLGFQVQVNLPYATMINYLQLLGLSDPEIGMAQRAWSLLNDAWVYVLKGCDPCLELISYFTSPLLSLQTPVYALFPPHVLAAAAIYLASLTLNECPPLPLTPRPWWELFDATREELRIVSSYLLRLYAGTPQHAATNVLEGSSLESATEDVLLSHGLASRVRDEHGGLVEFLDRGAVRDWLAVYRQPAPSSSAPGHSPREMAGALHSTGSTPLRHATTA